MAGEFSAALGMRCQRGYANSFSPGEATGVEKGLLLRRHHASEHRVAMGEPAETANDAGMELGICHEFIVAISARQLHASFLIGGIFRVHERHIEEAALLLRHLP